MSRKWTFLASLIVAVGILAVLFQSVSLDEVLNLINRAERSAVLIFFVFSILTSLFRVWRYRIILRTNGFAPPLPGLFLTTLVRNTCSDLLPARLGSLIYVFLATTRLGLPLPVASSSFALAFLFDIIGITPLILIALMVVALPEEISPWVLSGGAVSLLLIVSFMIAYLPQFIRYASSILCRFRFLSDKVTRSLTQLSDSIAARCEETKRAGVFGRLLIISLFIRLGKYVSLYYFLLALLLPLGYESHELSFSKTFIGLCASEMAASLPISGIAGFGTYQLGWVFTFTLLGFPLELATLTSLSHHLFTQAYGYSLGFAALLLLLLPVFSRSTREVTVSPGVAPIGSFALLIAFYLVLAVSLSRLAASS